MSEPLIPFNGDESVEDLFTRKKSSRCVIPWERTRIGQFFTVDFEGRKGIPSVPDRLKNKGYVFENARIEGDTINGKVRNCWLFKRVS